MIASNRQRILLGLLSIALVATLTVWGGNPLFGTQQAAVAVAEPLQTRLTLAYVSEAEALEVSGWAPVELAAIEAEGIDWADVLQVRIVLPARDINNLPPVIGDYTITGTTLVFQPRYGWSAGESYVARLDMEAVAAVTASESAFAGGQLDVSFFIPSDDVPNELPTVTQIYPTAAELPENLLRFYIEFSQPMQRGDVYDVVQLVDSGGNVVEHPFLRIGQEFWSRDMQLLTIILDPGRIKEGVAPNVQAGAPLDETGQYELVINAGFEDAYGRTVTEPVRKPFTVVAADHTSPNPDLWTLSAPQQNTQQPLVITLDGMIDPILARRLIRVEDARQNRVEGAISFDEREQLMMFTPAQPWANREYRLAVSPTLEDYAGNRVESLFDMAAGTVAQLEATTAEREPVYRDFQVR